MGATLNNSYLSKIRDLRGRSAWNLNELIPVDFPDANPEQPKVRESFQVIKPTNVLTGSVSAYSVVDALTVKEISQYRGPAFFVGDGQKVLRPGDLAISMLDGSAIIIAPEMKGRYLSRFHWGLRGGDAEKLALWAALNSFTGVKLRRLLVETVQGPGLSLSGLLGLTLPVIDTNTLTEIRQLWLQSTSVMSMRAKEAEPSWWRTTTLNGLSWNLALSAPDPERVLSGTPLRDYVEIFRGRIGSRKSIESENSFLNDVEVIPIANGSFVSTGEIDKWARRELSSHGDQLMPGDLAVSWRNGKLVTQKVTTNMLLSIDVVGIRARDGEVIDNVRAFMSTEEASEKWKALNATRTVQMASPKLIGDLRLSRPLSEYKTEIGDSFAAPQLSLWLEDLLWN